MGLQIRMVTKNWGHPKDETGKFIPLYNTTLKAALEEFDVVHKEYLETRSEYLKKGIKTEHLTRKFNELKDALCEDPDAYMPEFENPLFYQIYETVSFGTPICPPMDSELTLARYMFRCKMRPYSQKALDDLMNKHPEYIYRLHVEGAVCFEAWKHFITTTKKADTFVIYKDDDLATIKAGIVDDYDMYINELQLEKLKENKND